MGNRVLPPHKIPSELWAPRVLRLPVVLSQRYTAELDARGLTEASTQKGDGGIHGGLTAAETLQHFAQRFAVSAGRIEFVTLGPDDAFSVYSDALLSTFSEGAVALLDIPCGTGAMSASLIATLITLRRARILPMLPLAIHICAGDFSDTARDIFSEIVDPLVQPAAEVGIVLSTNVLEWNAFRGDHAARLIDAWFLGAPTAEEWFICVSNFSGALEKSEDFAQFEPCLEAMLARLHSRRATLLWVEPATKAVKRTLIGTITAFIAKRASWFSSVLGPDAEFPSGEYGFEHPVSKTVFRSNVAVTRFVRS